MRAQNGGLRLPYLWLSSPPACGRHPKPATFHHPHPAPEPPLAFSRSAGWQQPKHPHSREPRADGAQRGQPARRPRSGRESLSTMISKSSECMTSCLTYVHALPSALCAWCGGARPGRHFHVLHGGGGSSSQLPRRPRDVSTQRAGTSTTSRPDPCTLLHRVRGQVCGRVHPQGGAAGGVVALFSHQGRGDEAAAGHGCW